MQKVKENKLRCRSVSVIVLLTLFLCFCQMTVNACENERTQNQIVISGQDDDISEADEGNKPVREYEIGTITSQPKEAIDPGDNDKIPQRWMIGVCCLLVVLLLTIPLFLYGLKHRKIREREGVKETTYIPLESDWVTLIDIDNPQRRYYAPLQSKIVIGCEEGEIRLWDNPEASRIQFELLKIGNLYYIKDLKSSCGTFYQGMRTKGRTPVISGGILGIGSTRYRLMIERQPFNT